jgi:hypothetical protein
MSDKTIALHSDSILQILDKSAEAFVFPMLDNGYVYLAASRLSAFRSVDQWAIVFEIFGFSPRAGIPDLSIVTIGSQLHNRNSAKDYVSSEAYENYLKNNPNWEMRSFWPISNDEWIDQDNCEHLDRVGQINLRNEILDQPTKANYETAGIELSEDKPIVFELCRYLAHIRPDAVLATEAERRVSIVPEMEQIILLNEWHHPDLVAGQLPSQTNTFQCLAAVIERSNASLYKASEPANNHWKHWPDGGSL